MEATKNSVVVVCGATGKQGGAVLEALAAQGGKEVRALVRNPDRARDLAQRGVMLAHGDLLDRTSLTRAFKGADIVFGVTQPWKPSVMKADTREEIKQGKNIVDACKEVGATLVLSTQIHVDDKPTGLPHGDSKLEIENYAKASGVPLVNVRPASFLDNIGLEWFPVRKGKVQGLTDHDVKLPYIATHDIGRCVAAVIANLADYIGHHLNLVTGLYSGDDIAAALSRLRGERFRYVAPPKLMMRLFFNEFYRMRLGFEEHGRPPFPSAYTEGLEITGILIQNPVLLEIYLQNNGYETKQLK